MTTPKRIQRQRTKGWRMPPNCVYVGRPSNWGNPFVVGETFCDEWVYNAARAKVLFREEGPEQFMDGEIEQLRGKDLACLCKPSEPCHADVLL